MEVTETKAEGLRHEFRIVIPAATLEDSITKRLKSLGQQVRLPGFRPGKVPLQILKQRFGEAVRGEVVQETVDEQCRQTLTDRGLEAAYRPDVTLEDGGDGAGDLAFTLSVDVMPEIPDHDFSTLELERLDAEVSDEVIDTALGRLASANKRFEPLAEARPAAMGDLVVVDYTLAIDGAETQPDPVEGFRVELGGQSLPEAVQAALVGADAGETRTAVATLADDHPNPDLAGHSVEYTVTVKEIQSLAAAPEGEALAKELGLETLDELRNALRSQHQNELSQLSRARLKRQLLDRLSDIFDFPVPQRLVDMDFDGIWRQIETAKQRQANGEAEPDPDLDKPEEDLRAEYRAIAERRVRLGLLLAHLGRSNGITVPDEAVNSALIREAMQFPGHEREMYEAYRKVPAIVDQLRERLLEDKVVDYIIELAQVTDKTVSEEELRREPEDATSIRGHAHGVSGGEHVHDASCGHHVHGDPPADDASGANDAPEEASR